MVRAKMRCVKNQTTGDYAQVELVPVIDGSPENKEFYKYTPGGNVVLGTINPAAAKEFVEGGEYYVDFTKAPV